MTVKAVFSFEDNNGKSAALTLHLPGDAITEASTALASVLASALAALSDAKLLSVDLSVSVALPGSPPAESTSSCERTGVLFYRNGENVASISVPSIRNVLAESAGPFAGRRITRDSVVLPGMPSGLDGIPVGALDPARRAYGGDFSVGCITGNQE